MPLSDADRQDPRFRAGYLSAAVAGAIADLEADPTGEQARRVAASLRRDLQTCGLEGPTAERVADAKRAADGRRMRRRWDRRARTG